MSTKDRFRVLIAGGGIAGLSLANALQRANIDCLVLEARDEIAPHVGASIAINANGGRILDQLGIYDVLAKHAVPATFAESFHNGRLYNDSDSMRLSWARTGYPFVMLDRQIVMQKLYEGLPDKTAVLLEKRVSRVDHLKEGIVVQCKDGSSYEGDIIVGADGVHSLVRREMWRQANLVNPGEFSESQQSLMMAEYSCIYGVSSNVPGLKLGGVTRILAKDLSFLILDGEGDRAFWFVFKKMDKKYRIPDIPRFEDSDAVAQIESVLNQPFTDKLTFADLWKQRSSYKLVPLEEGLFLSWTWGRFVCIGDSIHKMTPNIGQGGNNAIESAAALANELEQLLRNKTSASPSKEEIAASLKAFQKHREVRTKWILKLANKVTRIEALAGFVNRFIALYFTPNSGDFLANKVSPSMIGSEKLNFLPDPPRSLTATMAYNQNYGIGKEESRLKRACVALPLIVLAYFCHTTMQRVIERFTPDLVSILASGKIRFGDGREFSITNSHYGGISWLERLWRPIVILFSPALLNIDSIQRLQTISFLADLAPLYLIWVLEGHRRANTLSFARFTIFFGIAFQMLGIGRVAPLFYFLHYVQSPLETFTAFDQRLVNVAAATTALPALLIAYMFPTLAMYFAPTFSARLQLNAVWQLFPVWVFATHYLISRYAVTDTTKHDRIYSPSTDLPSIRSAARTLAIFSGVIFNLVRFTSPYSLLTIFFPSFVAISATGPVDIVAGMALFLRVDHVACFAASFAWLALLFWDMKEVEMISHSWTWLAVCLVVGTCVTGPGAVFVLGWLWREEVLATKRAKGAVVANS